MRAVEAFLSSGVSINKACALGCVERRVFYRWKKTLSHLKNGADRTTVAAAIDMHVDNKASLEIDGADRTKVVVVTEMPVDNEATLEIAVVPPVVVPMTVAKITNGHACSLNTRRVSFLASKKLQLLPSIYRQLKQGLEVMPQLVQKVAEKLIQQLCEKIINACIQLLGDF